MVDRFYQAELRLKDTKKIVEVSNFGESFQSLYFKKMLKLRPFEFLADYNSAHIATLYTLQTKMVISKKQMFHQIGFQPMVVADAKLV